MQIAFQSPRNYERLVLTAPETKLTAADEAVLRDFRKRKYAEARAEVRRMRVLLQRHREKLERLAELTHAPETP